MMNEKIAFNYLFLYWNWNKDCEIPKILIKQNNSSILKQTSLSIYNDWFLQIYLK